MLAVALIAPLVLVVFLDWRRRRVPNTVTVFIAAVAVAALIVEKNPFGNRWIFALIAVVGALVALLPFYALNIMGAADVKFAAALGLWVGPQTLLLVWIGASLVAGVHALALLRWRRHMGGERARKREIPYAAHMACVTLGWIAWQYTR